MKRTHKLDSGLAADFYIAEPLLSMVRAHFNCQRLPGAMLQRGEIEEEGGSHFNRKMFFFDMMNPFAGRDDVITKFALAFFESTGWYKPDYSKATDPLFGKNEGCEFIFGPCISNTDGSSPRTNFNDEFCADVGLEFCTSDRKSIGKCGGGGGF